MDNRDKISIACIGAVNVDRKARILQEVRLHSSNPVQSEMTGGGVARNIGEYLGRLGTYVNMITQIGNDADGEWIRKQSELFVHFCDPLIHPTEKTGSYTAILDSSGDMVLAIAEMAIYDDVDLDFIQRRWHYISSAHCVVLDTNYPSSIVAYIIERCANEQIPLCVVPGSRAKAYKLPNRLQGVSHLIVNKEEAEIVAELPISSVEDTIKAGECLLQKGVENVIITHGARGVFCKSASEEAWIEPPEIPVVDVTGAGDAFAAGYLYARSKGDALYTACTYGMCCSTLCLQTNETVPSILDESLIIETYQTYFGKEKPCRLNHILHSQRK